MVRPGYKQTDVGVIPEDWTIVPLSELVNSLEAGVSVRSLDAADPHVYDKAVLKTSCIFGGRFNPDECKPIDPRDLHRAKLNPRNNCILISRMNTLALVGECGYVGRDYPNLYLPDRIWMTKHNSQRQHSVRWLNYLLAFGASSRSIKELGTGTSGSMKNIPKSALLGVPIPLPPTRAEQEAIAGALSDADALIESLEKLIAKKRQIKQGAMQELLTGKTRLPGFSGEWSTHELSELGSWKGGMTPSMRNAKYWDGGRTPWIASGDVKTPRLLSTALCVTQEALKDNATTLVPADSVIFVMRSGILRRYLPVAIDVVPMAINQDIKALLPNELASDDYLLYALTFRGDDILSRCLKTGTTVESIEFGWLKAFEIILPSRVEQSAIATILSDMDAEIAALETKLAKARQIKQGMMQELLTGRIRLVESEGNTTESAQ